MNARRLLWPLTLAYRIGYFIDRRRKLARAYRSRLPVISVGNLSVGGSGKTPLVIYLVHLLQQHCPVIVLSRGYGRATPSPAVWSAGDPAPDPERFGDEPCLVARHLRNGCIAVGSDRSELLRSIEEKWGDAVVLLDDGFQHWAIDRDLDLVIVDQRTVEHPAIMPAGDLREPPSRLQRADVVLATSTEAASFAARHVIDRTPVLRIDFRPLPIKRWRDDAALGPGTPVVLVTGIARPGRVVDSLRSLGHPVIRHLTFRDHHRYQERDVREILRRADGAAIVATAKDAVKLERFPTLHEALYVVDIEVVIAEEERIRSIVMSAARLNPKQATNTGSR